MNKTVKLYYENSCGLLFDAVVLSCESVSGGYEVILDKTLFYPEGGGQPSDTGVLGGARCLHVREKDGVILHLLEAPLAPGESVSGEIDWERRFSFMQRHTGEHIVSGILHSKYGLSNVGFHMGAAFTTIDTSAPVSEEELREVELLANMAVYENIPLESSFPDGETLRTLDFRSKLPESALIGGEIRVVSVPGYDSCACCGVHCGSTGEVGVIKFTSFQKYKSGSRIYMLCGLSAVQDYAMKNESIYAIAQLLSVKPEETLQAVQNLTAEKASLVRVIADYKNQLFAITAGSIPSGVPYYYRFEPGLTPDDLKRFASQLSEKAVIAAVFSGAGETFKYAVSGKSGVREFAKAMNAALGGRGGGQDDLAQGSVYASVSDIERYFEGLTSRS